MVNKGPSFAVEPIERSRTLLILGYKDQNHYDLVKKWLKNCNLFRLYQ